MEIGNRTLRITLSDSKEQFTDQLVSIIEAINDGKSGGTGVDFEGRWQIETKGDSIHSTWHIEDVKEIARDLTDEQCRKVLELAEYNHDADVGISWDVLRVYANTVREEQ